MRAFVVDTMLCCLPEKLWEEAHVVVIDKHVLMTMVDGQPRRCGMTKLFGFRRSRVGRRVGRATWS